MDATFLDLVEQISELPLDDAPASLGEASTPGDKTMGNRVRKIFVWCGMGMAACLGLSQVLPTRSVVTVSGPDGEYRIDATGPGPQHIRLELSDGSFVECGSK